MEFLYSSLASKNLDSCGWAACSTSTVHTLDCYSTSTIAEYAETVVSPLPPQRRPSDIPEAPWEAVSSPATASPAGRGLPRFYSHIHRVRTIPAISEPIDKHVIK